MIFYFINRSEIDENVVKIEYILLSSLWDINPLKIVSEKAGIIGTCLNSKFRGAHKLLEECTFDK